MQHWDDLGRHEEADSPNSAIGLSKLAALDSKLARFQKRLSQTDKSTEHIIAMRKVLHPFGISNDTTLAASDSKMRWDEADEIDRALSSLPKLETFRETVDAIATKYAMRPFPEKLVPLRRKVSPPAAAAAATAVDFVDVESGDQLDVVDLAAFAAELELARTNAELCGQAQAGNGTVTLEQDNDADQTTNMTVDMWPKIALHAYGFQKKPGTADDYSSPITAEVKTEKCARELGFVTKE